MNTGRTLSKVYKSSATVIIPIIVLLCLVCQWPLLMSIAALMASAIISCPATISLHVLVCLSQKIRFERSFAWMVLMASVPLLSFAAAWLFADFVPGKIWFLLLFGMLSGYVGLLSHGFSVAQFFNSHQYAREKSSSID